MGHDWYLDANKKVIFELKILILSKIKKKIEMKDTWIQISSSQGACTRLPRVVLGSADAHTSRGLKHPLFGQNPSVFNIFFKKWIQVPIILKACTWLPRVVLGSADAHREG